MEAGDGESVSTSISICPAVERGTGTGLLPLPLESGLERGAVCEFGREPRFSLLALSFLYRSVFLKSSERFCAGRCEFESLVVPSGNPAPGVVYVLGIPLTTAVGLAVEGEGRAPGSARCEMSVEHCHSSV